MYNIMYAALTVAIFRKRNIVTVFLEQ